MVIIYLLFFLLFLKAHILYDNKTERGKKRFHCADGHQGYEWCSAMLPDKPLASIKFIQQE